MSATDKAKNKVEEAAGTIKEKAGQASGDHDLEARGKSENVKGNLKQAGEKVKGAVKH